MNPSQQLAAVADEAWATLTVAEPYYAAKAGLPIERLPRGDLEEAEANAAAGRRRLERLAAIPDAGLDRTGRLTKATLAWLAEADTAEPEVKLSTFGVAPYLSSAFAMTAPLVFQPFVFDGGAGDERYLRLVRDFAGSVEAQSERIEHQAARGWRLPKPALPTARATIAGLAQKLSGDLQPSVERLAAAKPGLGERISSAIEAEVRPAFDRLLESIGEAYEAEAPETVGMGQYPGGEEAYRLAIKLQLSWPAEPEEIHAKGLEEVAQIADAMAALRSRAFGFDGEEAEFHPRLQADPRVRAASPEALAATYRGHLARMEPRISALFERRPDAAYDIERLAPELEAGMTFGFYRPPQPGEPRGIYFYSCNGLETRPQLNAAPLIFHELLPGHHFHIARQTELTDLPAIRREVIAFNAFNEGWAEYAAGLAEEEGLYENPYDLYGYLTHQRFVAQRLVVDTGMNALGWSLERARAYMSANTLEGPTQVASETLRYSTDMPAQALAYRWGFLKMRELRQRARERLGAAFDIRAWHEAILSQGGLPLTVLDQSLAEWEAGEQAGKTHAAV
jgi:uncharacterized protein (DUF885 family)